MQSSKQIDECFIKINITILKEFVPDNNRLAILIVSPPPPPKKKKKKTPLTMAKKFLEIFARGASKFM